MEEDEEDEREDIKRGAEGVGEAVTAGIEAAEEEEEETEEAGIRVVLTAAVCLTQEGAEGETGGGPWGAWTPGALPSPFSLPPRFLGPPPTFPVAKVAAIVVTVLLPLRFSADTDVIPVSPSGKISGTLNSLSAVVRIASSTGAVAAAGDDDGAAERNTTEGGAGEDVNPEEEANESAEGIEEKNDDDAELDVDTTALGTGRRTVEGVDDGGRNRFVSAIRGDDDEAGDDKMAVCDCCVFVASGRKSLSANRQSNRCSAGTAEETGIEEEKATERNGGTENAALGLLAVQKK